MNSRKIQAALGFVVVLVMVVATYVAFKSSEGLPLSDRSFAKAAFNDSSALRVGNEVRVNQRNVGRVASIELRDGRAVVTMQFDEPRPIYRNATAQILSRSGLGQVFVDVRPGNASAGELGENDVLPVARTKDYTQVLDLVTELDPKTRQRAMSAVRELGSGAAGHGRDLHQFLASSPQLLTDLGDVSGSLATNSGGDLTSMLSSLDRLSSRFDGRQQQITSLIDQLGTTFDSFAIDGAAPLKASLDAAPGTQRELRDALAALDRPLTDTGVAMSTLRSGSRALGQATPDLRGVLTESAEPLGKVEAFADSANPAVSELTGVMADARPVAPKVTKAVDSAQVPLTVLAPYAPEIAKWFSYATSALGDGDTAGHWLRFSLIPATDSASGNLPLRDPLTNSDPYPEPGEAPGQRAPQAPLGDPTGLLQGGN